MQPTRAALAICTPVPYEVTKAGNVAAAMISIEWHRARMSLAVPTNWNSIELFIDGEEVGDARNIAVQKILALSAPPTFLFFLDYDVLPAPDALTKLIYRAACFPEHDIFCGVYTSKGSPGEPLIYKANGHGPFWDWSIGDLLTGDTEADRITSCHMGLTLIRTSLFQRMDQSKPLFLTQGKTETQAGGVCKTRGTEDIYFCTRAVEAVGARILVHTSVLAGHQDFASRMIVGLPDDSPPVVRAKWLRHDSLIKCMDCAKTIPPKEMTTALQALGGWCQCDPAKRPADTLKALDIGAGGQRRQWPGYRTFTTDIRRDTKPDYVMDSRLLNLPDESFDLTASSHHLEHIGRLDQERVWAEIFRITKPGGKCEHIVPNWVWAANKLIEAEKGYDDSAYEHVGNVCYGAQEAHGYERIYNTHFMLYTPRIAKELAEGAGFVDVTTESYRENEGLGYNLIIQGRKPGGKKEEADTSNQTESGRADSQSIETGGKDLEGTGPGEAADNGAVSPITGDDRGDKTTGGRKDRPHHRNGTPQNGIPDGRQGEHHLLADVRLDQQHQQPTAERVLANGQAKRLAVDSHTKREKKTTKRFRYKALS